MAWDYFKPRGRAKASEPDAGGGVIRSEPVFGVVKDNVDPVRAGRLQVYIADFGAPDPDDSSSWVTVGFMTPFFGKTTGSGGETDYGSYLQNPTSYGMWFSPPDIGSTVVCIFINGDMNYGYYIGAVPEPEALTMVPAIGAVEDVVMNEGEANSYGGATKLPVANLNENNSAESDGAGFLTTPKPVHSYVAGIYSQQGLLRDPIRGPVSSSAQRESPSRVGWGVSTPGRPIYEGGYTDETILVNLEEGSPESLKLVSRRGGHSIVMDDGDLIGRDQLIRIRTALGHQIILSDDGQCLNIMHSNGQSWIELGKEGTIDMYSMNSVNVRTQGDLNLHADNNININAKKELNISADSIHVNSENDTTFRVGANFNGYSVGNYSFKVDGSMSMGAGGEGSYASAGVMFINGSDVNLNTGSGTAPSSVKPLPIVSHTDALFDKDKGWAAAPGKLQSIVSRAPSHAPWANANQGVNVKVTNNASAELPSAPSKSVAQTNQAAGQAPVAPTNPALVATVPAVSPVSTSLDKNVTGSMVSGVAASAAQALPNVVASGTGIAKDATGELTAFVGKLAQTPAQLETAGILKPGSSTVINGLIQSGKTVAQAMPSNLFTGAPGAENLTKLTNNVSAQVDAQVANFKQAQSALTQTGVITGKEAPTQIAGLVTAGSQVGIPQTIDFVKNSAGTLAKTVGGALNSVSDSIASGNFAAKLGTDVKSGLSSLATSVNGLVSSASSGIAGLVESAKGIAASAFSAITESFKAFKANVPQNLREIAKKNQEDLVAKDASGSAISLDGVSSGALSATGNISMAQVSSVANSLGVKIPSSLTSLASGGAPSIAQLTSTASSLGIKIPSDVTALASSASKGGSVGATQLATVANSLGLKLPVSPSTLASGLNALPGGLSATASVVDKATTSFSLPGLSDVKSLINAEGSAKLNNISLADVSEKASSMVDEITGKSTQSLTSLVSSGLPPGAAAQLSAAISALSSTSGVQVKIPTVATNTVDRSEVNSLIKNNFGDSKIPPPDFSGTSQAEISAKTETLADYKETLKEQQQRFNDQLEVAKQAKAEWVTAYNSLPAGDPKITELKKKYEAEYKKALLIADEIA
jgi:hypothetical protein